MSKSLGNVVRPLRHAGALRHGRVPLLPAARDGLRPGRRLQRGGAGRRASTPTSPTASATSPAACSRCSSATSRARSSRSAPEPADLALRAAFARRAPRARRSTSAQLAFHRGARGALARARPRQQVRHRHGAVPPRQGPGAAAARGRHPARAVRGAAGHGPAGRAVPAGDGAQAARLSSGLPEADLAALDLPVGHEPSRRATAPSRPEALFPARRKASLKTTFKIGYGHDASGGREGTMILCICRGVSEARVVEAVRCGARTARRRRPSLRRRRHATAAPAAPRSSSHLEACRQQQRRLTSDQPGPALAALW